MDDAQIAQTLRFINAVFGPDDVVLLRPIEVWVEADKKRSRTIYDSTGHHRAAAIQKLFVGSLNRMAAKERANLFFGVCPRPGRGGCCRCWPGWGSSASWSATGPTPPTVSWPATCSGSSP